MRYIALLLLLPALAYGGRLNPERHYQELWCNNVAGETEVILEDRTRVDCETYYHVIEHDFADKWAESVGQALHYAAMTGKKAGIVLIVEKPEHKKYYDRVKNLIEHHKLPIDLFTIEPQ